MITSLQNFSASLYSHPGVRHIILVEQKQRLKEAKSLTHLFILLIKIYMPGTVLGAGDALGGSQLVPVFIELTF